MKNAGFTVGSFSSNHCLDYGFDAFNDTIDHCNAAGVNIIGAGRNLADARKPYISEANGNRIGWLAYGSILPRRYAAEAARGGVAPARAHTIYEPIEFGQPGGPARVHSVPYEEDMQAILDDIAALRPSVDIVIVSFHWGIHFKEGELADYEKIYARRTIEGGADIILGHHQHILKPMELYRGKPIFYGMNMFAFDMFYPEDDWNSEERQARTAILHPGWKRDPKFKTFPFPVDSRKSLLVDIECADGKVTGVSWTPVMINEQGQPRCLNKSEPEFDEVVEYMKKITAGQKLATRFEVSGNRVTMTA
jgi:poly-gamma-glutamate synthesis protein (capsule biosynthesis protein)